MHSFISQEFVSTNAFPISLACVCLDLVQCIKEYQYSL